MAAGVRMSLLKPLYRASIAFLICLSSAHAGEAYNAATLYIKGANQAEYDIIRVMFHNPSDSSFVHMYNDKNEKLCTGVLRSRGQNILLDDFSCNSGVLKFTNMEMHEVKKSSQMVMHVIGKIKNFDDTQIGLVVALPYGYSDGRFTQIISDEDISRKYGRFPDWKLP